MAQQLGDLLKDKSYGEPPEIKLIKDFVQTEIGLIPQVKITENAYLITVPYAAAAGILRASLFKLQKELGDEKRLLIRIG